MEPHKDGSTSARTNVRTEHARMYVRTFHGIVHACRAQLLNFWSKVMLLVGCRRFACWTKFVSS